MKKTFDVTMSLYHVIRPGYRLAMLTTDGLRSYRVVKRAGNVVTLREETLMERIVGWARGVVARVTLWWIQR